MAFSDEIIKLRKIVRPHLRYSGADNPPVSAAIDGVHLYGLDEDSTGADKVYGTVERMGSFSTALVNIDEGFEVPTISTSLIDDSNVWRRRWAEPWNLIGRLVYYVLRVRQSDGTYLDTDVAWGQLGQPSFAPGKVTLTVEQQAGDYMGAKIPRRKVTLDDWPNADPSALGRPVPIIYGKYDNQAVGAIENFAGSLVGPSGTLITSFAAAATAGGNASAVAGTYYYAIAPIDANGQAYAGHSTTSVTITAGQRVQLTWTAYVGATSLRLWRSSDSSFGQMDRKSTDLAGGATSFDDDYAGLSIQNPPEDASATGWELEYRQQRYYWLSAVVGGVEQYPVGPLGFSLAPLNLQAVRAAVLTWSPVTGADSLILRRGAQTYGYDIGYDRQWNLSASTTGHVDWLNDTSAVVAAQFLGQARAGALELLYVDTNPAGQAGQYKYLVAGHGCKEVREVYVTRPTNPSGGVDLPVIQTLNTDYFVQVEEINGNRYQTVRFNPAQDGRVVTANVWGVEANGTATGNDDGGTLIESAILQFRHFLYNWVFNSYRTGSWLTTTGFRTGLIDDDSFTDADTASAVLITGGYKGGGALLDETEARQVIRDWIVTCGVDWYYWDGQFHLSLVDTLPSRASLRRYTPQLQMFKETFLPELDTSRLANRVPWQAGPQYDGWLLSGEENNTEAQGSNRYGRIIEAPILSLLWTRDLSTARSVVQRWLNSVVNPRSYGVWRGPLAALNDPPSTRIAVTHPDGIALQSIGWDDRICKIVRTEIDFDTSSVALRVQDIEDIASAGADGGLVAGDGPEYVTLGTTVVPEGRRGISLTTAAGSAWEDTDWVQIAGEDELPSEPWVFSGLHIETMPDLVQAEFDVALSPLDEPEIIATYSVGGNTNGENPYLTSPIPYGPIQPGRALWVRVRTLGFFSQTVDTMFIKAIIYDRIPSPQISMTLRPLKCYPSGTTGLSVTASTTAWANGTWQELIAATLDQWSIAGLTIGSGALDAFHSFEVQLGTGSGTPTVITTFRFSGRSAWSVYQGLILDHVLVDRVPLGTRLALRIRQTGTAGGSHRMKVQYYEGEL